MANIEREQIAALARKSVTLRELWLRERQEILAEQLAVNDQVKKRWQGSDAIEIQQQEAVNGTRRK
jgi:hypothetical protein